MKHNITRFSLLLILGVVSVSGCAKQELVKKDDMISPSVTTAQVTPAVKSPSPESVVKEQVVKEAPLNDNAANASGREADLKNSLGKIFFDFDSYQLTPAARDTLVKNAKLIKSRGGAKLRIEGHCDERGSDEYNLALGEKRAKVAMQYLVTLGVPAGNLSVISYGKEKPADPGHSEAAWAKNRRDEFVVGAQ